VIDESGQSLGEPIELLIDEQSLRGGADANLDFAFWLVAPVLGMVVWIHGNSIWDVLRRHLTVPAEPHRHDLCIRGKSYGLVLLAARAAVDTLAAGFFIGADRIRSFLFGLRQPKSHPTSKITHLVSSGALIFLHGDYSKLIRTYRVPLLHGVTSFFSFSPAIFYITPLRFQNPLSCFNRPF